MQFIARDARGDPKFCDRRVCGERTRLQQREGALQAVAQRRRGCAQDRHRAEATILVENQDDFGRSGRPDGGSQPDGVGAGRLGKRAREPRRQIHGEASPDRAEDGRGAGGCPRRDPGRMPSRGPNRPIYFASIRARPGGADVARAFLRIGRRRGRWLDVDGVARKCARIRVENEASIRRHAPKATDPGQVQRCAQRREKHQGGGA